MCVVAGELDDSLIIREVLEANGTVHAFLEDQITEWHTFEELIRVSIVAQVATIHTTIEA